MHGATGRRISTEDEEHTLSAAKKRTGLLGYKNRIP
jgi:hypothetical protein